VGLHFLFSRSLIKFALQTLNHIQMENLKIEIKTTDQEGKSVKANVDYVGYLETKKVHNISLVEDVMNHLIREMKELKK